MSYPVWTGDIHVGTLGDQNPRLGRVVRTADGSEFIFLKGVGSLAVGDWVVYYSDYSVARMVSTPLPGRVAVSLAANTTSANQSWYQIRGLVVSATILSSASADTLPLFQSSSTGLATTTPAATKAVFNAFAVGTANTSNVGNAFINHPFCMGTATL